MKISDISTLYKGRGSNHVTPSTFSYYHFYIRSLSFICQLDEKWSKATLRALQLEDLEGALNMQPKKVSLFQSHELQKQAKNNFKIIPIFFDCIKKVNLQH